MEPSTPATSVTSVPHANQAARPLPDVPPQMFGIPASDSQLSLQMDAHKELVNKLAWVLGSYFRVPYSGAKSTPRLYAQRIAKAVFRDHGYPRKIAK